MINGKTFEERFLRINMVGVLIFGAVFIFGALVGIYSGEFIDSLESSLFLAGIAWIAFMVYGILLSLFHPEDEEEFTKGSKIEVEYLE